MEVIPDTRRGTKLDIDVLLYFVVNLMTYICFDFFISKPEKNACKT